MERISRQQAEQLCKQSEVVQSFAEQKSDLLCIHLSFADMNRCVVLYDLKTREKIYYQHRDENTGKPAYV